MAGLLSPSAAPTAPLLEEPARLEEVLEQTVRRWAGSGCDPHPCGIEVWRYACEAAGMPIGALPAHRTERQMVALLRRKGGLIAYAGELVEAIGWQRLEAPGSEIPQRGDVGVIVQDGHATCAICLGTRWMTKGDAFVRNIAHPIVLAAWRLG